MWVQGSNIVSETGEQVKGQLLQVLGEWGGGGGRGASVGCLGKCVIKRLVGCGETVAGCLHLFPSQEQQQSSVVGLNTSWERVSLEMRDYIRQQEAHLHWAVGLLHVLLSCTFLLVFHS